MSGVGFERQADPGHCKPPLRGARKRPYYGNVNIIGSDLVCQELSVLSGWGSSFDLSGRGAVNLHVIILPPEGVREHWVGNVF